MMKVLALALTLPLVACVVGDSGPAPGGGGGGQGGGGQGGGGGGGGSGSGSGDGTSGHITMDTTWQGTVNLTGTVTIDPGVTLTIAAGTTVNVPQGAEIDVHGTLDAAGAAGSIVTIQPAAGATHFGVGESGVVVGDGTNPATLTYTFVSQMGDGILVQNGATATITDSRMAQSAGDYLTTAPGSTVVVKYSAIGLEPGSGTDTTHCDTHFGGGTITLVHSNLSSSAYGSMFYGGMNAKFMYDNWFSDQTDVDLTPGSVTGDFSNGWFEQAPPATAAGITANNLSPTRLAACPADTSLNMTCAGPHGW